MSYAYYLTSRLALLGCVAFASAAAAQSPPAAEGVYWTRSVEQALMMARDTGAPILAYVTSEHCGYCRKMERETWSNPRIMVTVNESFVALELTAERDMKLIQQLGVTAFPTTLVFSPSGKVLTEATGFLPPLKAAELLRASLPPQPRVAQAGHLSEPHP